MALPPHNPTGPMGANGSTPQGKRYSDLPYGYWPEKRRPRVRCGACLEQMVPTGNAEYPHEFKCPGDCSGYVDVFPPVHVPDSPRTSHQPLSWHNHSHCGVYVSGVRCGKDIERGDLCCDSCADRIVTDMWERPRSYAGGVWRRREFILNLVGNLMMQRERAKRLSKEKRENEAKAEARRLARLDTSHNVVYYARLGHNHIKIGTTADLPRRMHELRVVNSNNLLAAEPGGPDVEKQRHQQFKKWRYNNRREDFGESRELHEHIGGIRAEHGDPYTLAAELARTAA